MAERVTLKEQIDKLDLRQEEWIELSKETFDFAFYARHHFATGDILTKVKIASKLGSNLTIKDKSLLISGDKPYFLIEKGKKRLPVLWLR